MKNVFLVLTLFISLAGAGTLLRAQSADEKAVADATTQLLYAYLTSDVEKLNFMMADDYINTNPLGIVRSKEDELTELKMGQKKYTLDPSVSLIVPQTYDKVRVLSPSAAFTTVHYRTSGTLNGQPISGQFRLMVIWQKRAGVWKVSAMQSTLVR